jgi:hypothetical protein
MAIRSICLHYEKKCSGQYSTNSLASRYIFQMTREIMSQLQAMSHNSGGQGQRVRDLENVLTEWNENFGREADEGTQGVFGIVPMTPTALKNTLVTQRQKIKELEAHIAGMNGKQDEAAKQVKEMMSGHAEAARNQAESDRERHQAALKSMRVRCDQDVAMAVSAAAKAKEEAKAAMEYDKKRATATVQNALATAKSDFERLSEEKNELEERLNREWASKLRHLELKVKNASDAQRIAVEKALDKVKRTHAAELASAVREAAMHAGQAAMKQAGSTGGLQPGSSAMASKARVEQRDSRRAGGGGDIMKREEEAPLVPLTADELAKGTDKPETMNIESTNPSNSASGGGGGSYIDRTPEINLLNLKLKNQTDESAWLRSRITDLETMVKTMRTAIEGSLEEGAGEKNFPGWRQVYAVQYPWLRDRKREDPARYSYVKGAKGLQRGVREGF